MLPLVILLAHLQDARIQNRRLCSGSIYSMLVSHHALSIHLWVYTRQGCLEPKAVRRALH